MIVHNIAHLPTTYRSPRDGIFTNVHPPMPCAMTFARWHMCLRMHDHAVCHYPIGVILSIAQGWQVQRSLPWVMDADRGLPTTWVVLSFAHIITHPNEAVGAVPACPPERPRSGVSIPKIHALYAGDEQRMRPCSATRAGTQAPPLPIPIIFFHATPHTQNNHLRTIHPNGIKHPHAILPNEINHPNETRKQSPHTQQSGTEMHRALPPPQL